MNAESTSTLGLMQKAAQEQAAANAERRAALAQESELARCQSMTEQAVADAHGPVSTLEELAADAGERDVSDSEPADEEIVDVYVEHFGGTREQADQRLRTFVGTVELEAA